ncbi:MAG: MBL fold metallo-hydrolase [Defluviitaleaceae bacterium]|nr:MBL fold metallo-hydrolase [Defluviitaleaceae bacterium]
MKIQYLGTAAAEGWPALFCNCEHCETARILGRKNIRTRSQTAIYANEVGSGTTDEILLIDLPPDTYLHVLQHGLRLDKIAHLVITHSHDDHFKPSELIYRCGIYANPVPNFTLNIYGNEKVHDLYKKTMQELDTDQWPTNIKFHVVEPFKPFSAGNFTVTPLLALHDITEQCFIYMIELANKRLLYANDTGIFPTETFNYIANKPFDTISLDCTSCGHKEGTNHMGLPDALEVKRRLEGLKCIKDTTKIILTHFSHNGGTCYDAMLDLAEPHNFEVAFDGAVWNV